MSASDEAAPISSDNNSRNGAREAHLSALEANGHPVIRIRMTSALDLLQEVFRWQIATAVIGSVLGVNPFSQPDVDAAKLRARELMSSSIGSDSPPQQADLQIDGVAFFASPALADAVVGKSDPVEWMRALLDRLEPSDVFALNVFLEERNALIRPLEQIRQAVFSSRRVATTLSIGPRYLHSSGQLQKGGPNSFVGLQIWQSEASRNAKTLAIPILSGSFDELCAAQANGDFSVLAERDRRIFGIDVGADPDSALVSIASWIEGALA